MYASFVLVPMVLCGPPDPAEVVKTVERAIKNYSTLRLRTRWEEYRQGSLDAAWDVEWFLDDQGRARIVTQPLAVPHRDFTARRSDRIFDGETSVEVTFDPTRGVDGQANPGFFARKGFRLARVNGGRSPPDGLSFISCPWDCVAQRFLETVRVPPGQGAVVVEPIPRNRVRVSYPGQIMDQRIAYAAVIDLGAGGVVLEWVGKTSKGVVVRDHRFTFRADGRGHPIPVEGTVRNYDVTARNRKPMIDWRYKVSECEVDHPDFDEEVFRIAIEPGTRVADTRFDVKYRVGQEVAFDADLDRLAKEAVRQSKAAPASRRHLQSDDEDSLRVRKVLLWGTAAAVCMLSALYAWRRMRSP